MTAWTWTDAVCTQVVDGDTIDLELTLDVGFGARTTHRVRGRLNRVNALPLKTADGKAAAAYVGRRIFGASRPALTVVTVAPYKFGGPHWSPGEWMVEVTLPDGKNLSDLLVTRGHAVYWDGSGPRPDVPVKATLPGGVEPSQELLGTLQALAADPATKRGVRVVYNSAAIEVAAALRDQS